MHSRSTARPLPESPYERLRLLYPAHVQAAFAPHHERFWEWIQALQPGVSPPPFVGIWARGGAKSTSAELGVIDAGARKRRRYCLYVSGTQQQADDHVQTIGINLESLGEYYPDMSERNVSKYGNSRGWRRNRLWTASGFVVDAIGLDTAARGVKLEEQRPDLIVLDDIDDSDDSPDTTRKKEEAITKRLIPAGSEDVAILAIQNLVIPNGVFARIANGEADMLANRILSGPLPALDNLTYVTENGRHRITHGEPTWEGQGIERCQKMLDDMGLTAFLSECQHEVDLGGARLVYGADARGVLVFHPKQNVVSEAPFRWRDAKWRLAAVDPGGRDPTAVALVGVSGEERMVQFGEFCKQGAVPIFEVAEWLMDIHNQAPFDAIWVDPSAAGWVSELRTKYGLPVYPANNDRRAGVSAVMEVFRSRRYTVLSECEQTLRQIASYWVKERKEGEAGDSSFATYTTGGHHGDLPDCIRYIVMGMMSVYPSGQPAEVRMVRSYGNTNRNAEILAARRAMR